MLVEALSAGINAATGIGNWLAQEEQRKYEKGVQQTTWDREDNAVQRRVADLRAAGLNPILAAGQGASTRAPITLTTPQIESKDVNVAQNALQALQLRSQVENTQAQNRLIDAQASKTEVERDFMASTMPTRIESTNLQTENERLKKELNELGVSGATLDNVAKEIKNKHDTAGLTEQEIDIIAKKVAVKVAEKGLEEKGYNLKWGQEHGLPTGMPNSIIQDMKYGSRVLDSFLNSGSGVINSTVNDVIQGFRNVWQNLGVRSKNNTPEEKWKNKEYD